MPFAKNVRMVRITLIRGFTLIELMLVIVLIAIFAAIGIPTYRSVTTSNRMAAEMNALVGDMQLARSEAIKRGQDTTVCASTDKTSCAGASTQSWTSGWVVLAPATTSNPLLRVHAALQGGDTLTSNGTTSPGAITFDRNGFSRDAQTLTLNDSGATIAFRRCAVISTVGRVQLKTGANCP